MRILVVENYHSCPVGVVGEQLEALGAELTIINALQRHQPIPDNAVQGYHGLVVLGGAMGAYDDEDFPQITAVLELLMQFHWAGKPILGLCLGAQMLARTLGGPFQSNDGYEIGFIPLAVTEAGQFDPLFAGGKGLGNGIDQWSPIEWHRDSFHLPSGAELLVRGEACVNQGFRVGRASYGFQFHPEMNAEIVTALVTNLDRDRLKEIGDDGRQLIDQMMLELPDKVDAAVEVSRLMTSRWYSLLS